MPHLTVQLETDAPPTTQVTLDGATLPRTALGDLDVDPGTHELVVSAPRRTTFKQTVDIAQSERKAIAVTLARLPTATLQVVFRTKPAGMTMEIMAQFERKSCARDRYGRFGGSVTS